MEGYKIILVDGFLQIDLLDHVVFTKLEDVLVIHAEGRRGEAQQKAGFEVVDDALIACRGHTVVFIYDDVVEVVRGEIGWVEIFFLG